MGYVERWKHVGNDNVHIVWRETSREGGGQGEEDVGCLGGLVPGVDHPKGLHEHAGDGASLGLGVYAR